ncbi:MAG: isoleucine--tRNA ligase [Candidatus Chisholmbacteria bacterium]|nr:isoleucine--tRNA ligase [Candidatus Chisholmbacteria bacterium]
MTKTHRIKPVPALTDFTKLEVKLLDHWYKSGIVAKYLHKNDASKKRFSFFDGPITANNPMGVHHGWGRTYKDLWQRYHNLKGFKQRFQNGFDCQGLWVEVEVEKELGFKSKKDIEKYGVAKFVEKCKDRVLKYAQIQTEQSKRLGYFMDWDDSYFTMSDANNYMIWHFLKVCHQNGWLYKGRESVPWCPRCETAISQHEMLTEDYQEVTHQAIYFTLPIEGRANEYLLVWTTTPWTLPANIAVAVDKTFTYSLVKSGPHQYWVAEDTLKRVFKDKPYSVIKTVKGEKLVGLKYIFAFDHLPAVKKVGKNHPKTFHTVVATDQKILPLTTDEGTGLVHTAVSAGTEDFKLGQKLGLPMVPVIKDNADYLEGLGFLSGQNAKNHPEIILNYLKREDEKPGSHWVFRIESYRHRYPSCWRCKTELVWKVTAEWYIAMDRPSLKVIDPERGRRATAGKHGKLTLRARMKKVARKIRWLPSFGLDRELDWLNHMHDWLISKKNRYWGLSLPIWECPKCGHFEVIGSKEELKKRAVAGWEEFAGKSPHKPQIDAIKIKCPKCGEIVSRIEPVGNPWLDAGIISFSTLIDPQTLAPSYTTDKKYWRDWFPADFITESFPGQFKNWFYSLIAMATVLEDSPPTQTILGFATLLAEDGRPMHKSTGNAIEFNQGAEKIGVDVMRWLYCRQNPENNLLFGYHTAAEVKRQFHLLLWNSYRFFANAASLHKYSPQQFNPQSLSVLDTWILSRLTQTQLAVEKHLDKFDAFRATQFLESLVTDFSTWYIRRSRDRVAASASNTVDLDTCLAVMYEVLVTLSKLLAPFIPYLSDTIYTNLTGTVSVHLQGWPEVKKSLIHQELEANMKEARLVIEKIHAQRKAKNLNLRQPLSAVTISGPAFGQPNLHELMLEEVNIKTLNFTGKGKVRQVALDIKLTPELKAEGEARELIRQIQSERKKLGTNLGELISIELPSWPQKFTPDIKAKTLALEIRPGPKLKVVRTSK